MLHSLAITDRDEQILQALCSCVRLFTLSQIAKTWWPANKRLEDDARRRLTLLERAGYLGRAQVLAAPLPPLDEPVLHWAPGDPDPDAGAIAWQLQSRWKDSPRLTTVYLATTKATGIFGGKARGRLKQEYQATHDLGVAQMYLNLRCRAPELVAHWIGEDILAPYRRRQKLPDAVIAPGPNHPPTVVLEFGGAYDKLRVQTFHDDCRDRRHSYELW